MSRTLRSTTRNPELVALTAIGLRNFAQGSQPGSPFETAMAQELRRLQVTQAQANQLVDNFERVSVGTRTRKLGPLAAPGAQIPADTAAGSGPGTASGEISVVRPLVVSAGGQVLVAGGGQQAGPSRAGIHYQGLYCIDETGNDDLGSDEIYVVTTAVHVDQHGENQVKTVRHPQGGNGDTTYGDVDSYNARIGPVASCWDQQLTSVKEAVSLITVVMERDHGDPDAFRDEIDTAVKAGLAALSAAVPVLTPINALLAATGFATDAINWLIGTGDDEVGTASEILDLFDLIRLQDADPKELIVERIALFENPPIRRENTGLFYHFLASVNDNDYHVGFQVV